MLWSEYKYASEGDPEQLVTFLKKRGVQTTRECIKHGLPRLDFLTEETTSPYIMALLSHLAETGQIVRVSNGQSGRFLRFKYGPIGSSPNFEPSPAKSKAKVYG